MPALGFLLPIVQDNLITEPLRDQVKDFKTKLRGAFYLVIRGAYKFRARGELQQALQLTFDQYWAGNVVRPGIIIGLNDNLSVTEGFFCMLFR